MVLHATARLAFELIEVPHAVMGPMKGLRAGCMHACMHAAQVLDCFHTTEGPSQPSCSFP
jgi:hypothetical protein